MAIQFNKTSDENSISNKNIKKKIALPIIALMLDVFPIVVIYLSTFIRGFSGILGLITLLSPIAGLILGVVALSQGKNAIGIGGKTIAIIAIALPLVLIGIIVLFFVGAATGIISFM